MLLSLFAVFAGMLLRLALRPPTKRPGMRSAPQETIQVSRDLDANRRGTRARLEMRSEDTDSALVYARLADAGPALSFDGVARNMPQRVRGVLRPEDSQDAMDAPGVNVKAFAHGESNGTPAHVKNPQADRALIYDGVARDMPREVRGVLSPEEARNTSAALEMDEELLQRGLHDPSLPQITGAGGVQKAVNAEPGPGADENPFLDLGAANLDGAGGSSGRLKGLRRYETEAVMGGSSAEAHGSDENAVLQLTVARAFSVAAADHPEGCSGGSCPAAAASDAAALVFDGGRMPGGRVGGAGLAGINGTTELAGLRGKAREFERAIDQCLEATRQAGKLQRLEMDRTRTEQLRVRAEISRCKGLYLGSLRAQEALEECRAAQPAANDSSAPPPPPPDCSAEENAVQIADAEVAECKQACRGFVPQANEGCLEANRQSGVMKELCPLQTWTTISNCDDMRQRMQSACEHPERRM